MKARIRTFSLVLLAAFLVGAGSSFFQIARNPEGLGRRLAARIQEQFDRELTFQEASLGFAPFPFLRGKQLRLGPETGEIPSLTAQRGEFFFHFFPLLFGRVSLSGFEIRGGKGNLGKIPFEDFDFKIKGIAPHRVALFEWKGRVLGSEATLRGKGSLTFKNPGENFWKDAGFKAAAKLNSLPLGSLKKLRLGRPFLPTPLSGAIEGTLQVRKEKGEDQFKGSLYLQGKDWTVGSIPTPFSISGEGEFMGHLQGRSLEFERLSFQTPFGRLDGTASLNLETGEVVAARLNGREIALDEVLRRFPNLEGALPLDTGFSGECGFDLSIRGTWDYLNFHGSGDLTRTLFTFGKIFSKPKEVPMGLAFDFLLEEGGVLSGDFSVRVRETTVKGSLVDLELKTGEGELTLLTNKFDLKGWRGLLTPIQNYQISGPAKVLVNWKGNLSQLDKARKMVNLTLENATLLAPSGRGFREANLLLDVSPLSLRLKEARFKIGTSPIEMEAEIYNPEGETPRIRVDAYSAQLEPAALFENLKEFRPFFASQGWRVPWAKIGTGLRQFFPESFPLESFELALRTHQDRLVLEELAFEALDGGFKARGERDWPSRDPAFWLEVTVDRVSLARYFEARGEKEPFLEGTLSLTGRFEKSSGQGALSITNGEWHPLKLMDFLRHLESFQSLSQRASASTPFHDLKATWVYHDGQFETSDFLLLSEDLWVEGEGKLSPEGVLNSRLDVSLSKFLTREILKSWQAQEQADARQLGPISLLLVGSLSQPELRQDNRRLAPFLESVRARRFRKILHEPLKERRPH